MTETEEIIQRYWHELPRETRIELMECSKNTSRMLERCALELDVDYEPTSEDGRARKEDIARFTVAVMEKFGGDGDD